MKRFLLITVIFLFSKSVFAEHITGGEMYYTFLGIDGVTGKYQYRITLKLYRDCNSPGAPLDDAAPIGIFSKANNAMISNQIVDRTKVETLLLGTPGPCIDNPPVVCYQVGYYEFTASLDPIPAGYIISYQRCCRINGISNLFSSGSIGATYTADIPGTASLLTAPENNSAKFVGVDTVIVCGGYPFTYSFAAVDPDLGDQLFYSFCSAFSGGGPSQGNGPGNSTPNPPAKPPYNGVNYSPPYNDFAPLGSNVTINPTTGLISGTSPPQGIYVVTVCVTEVRNGIAIATQRKDLQIKAGGCDIAKPQLKPEYITCDGFNFDFTHPNNPLINSYYWEFGDPTTGVNNIATTQNPSHLFSAAGIYTIKLVANRGQECSDSATAVIKVFPGFFPAFTTAGICLTSPIQFHDATTANYGVVDSWSWDFGDATSTADVDIVKDPSWQYADTGTKTVRLIVGSSMGCIDTLIKDIRVIDKPPITLAFRDTLICVPDAVMLQASGTGNFTWTPTTNMVNASSATPTVNPTTTTTYTVQLNEQGCINTDTVRIRVVTFVTISSMLDTTICLTDSVKLNITSDGLRYQWTPSATLNDPTLQDPMAMPTGTTNYQVIASIGSCTAPESILVTTVPYPIANAGPDTTICYNTPALLHGSHNGNSFTWSPVGSLTNATTLNPTANPARTTAYVLSSLDTRGCPKPGRDTVLVTLLPKIIPFAGHDTLVVVGQPLQLNAEGGVRYEWTPATGLNDPNIKNPLAIYDAAVDSIRYMVKVFNAAGCYDSAFMRVVVFKTNPYVFVPTAFTPNGDGLNDVIRPIAVGVQRINYFRVFNRWGQMVFATTINEFGWDGRIGGVPQGSNVYVWMVSALDYTGKTIFLKGTTTLIR